MGHFIPARPISEVTWTELDTISKLTALYLLHDSDLEILNRRGAVLSGNKGEEVDVISRFFWGPSILNIDKKIPVQNNPSFKSWQDLGVYMKPLTDILIIDRYIFSDISMYELNIYNLLEVICKYSRCPVNIVFYTQDDQTPAMQIPNIEIAIKERLKALTGFEPNITIVTYIYEVPRNNQQPKRGKHDRNIFTNYFRLESGDSFKNYFLSEGGTSTTSDFLTFHFNVIYDNFKGFKMCLDSIQNEIDIYRGSGVKYVGTPKKISNFLKL